MNIGLILAGGSGSRMGNVEKPKQFLKLGSKPIIIHTVEAFRINNSIDAILVLVPEVWREYTKDLLKRYDLDLDNIFVHTGGKTRNETIISGCNYIKENFGEHDYVLVTHDSVRPFITQRIINDNVIHAQKGFAIDTAIAAIDTIVHSQNGEEINAIPTRSELFQGQTPQTFYLSDFEEIIAKVSESDLGKFSDACGLFIEHGYQAKIVNGEQYNMKITTQFDLDLANAILKVNIDD